jgi:hypothetical protein
VWASESVSVSVRACVCARVTCSQQLLDRAADRTVLVVGMCRVTRGERSMSWS